MTTETLNLQKYIKKSWNFVEMFITLASTQIMFYIAIAHVLSLLWQLIVSIGL